MTLRSRTTILRFLLASVFAVLSGCGSNPDSPGIERIFLNNGTVNANTVETLSVEVFLDTVDTPVASRQSVPFSLAITLPIGVSYVPGTSSFSLQSVREPNMRGDCRDGRSFLSYDFATGEVDNNYNFEKYSADLNINVLVLALADGRNATVASRTVPFADPCNAPFDEEVEFHVSN